MKKMIGTMVLTSLIAFAPTAMAAPLPPTLATQWSQILATAQLQISMMLNQIRADQTLLLSVAPQLASVQVELATLNNANLTDAQREAALKSAAATINAAATQITAVETRWRGFVTVLKEFVPKFQQTATLVIETMRQ